MGQAKPIAQRKAPNKPVFYLLAGPNGAGKSTLYRALVLAGTIPASVEFVKAICMRRSTCDTSQTPKPAQNRHACGPMPAVPSC